MIKKLLIGASALALTTTVAHAQVATPAQAKTVGTLSISNVDIKGALNNTLNEGPGVNGTDGRRPSGDAETVDVNSPNRDGYYNTIARETTTTVLNTVNGSLATFGEQFDTTDGNKANTDQKGDDNTATVEQRRGNEGWAAVNQKGDWNQASVTQSEVAGGAGDLSAEGSANKAYVQQASSGTESQANGNTARITQVYDENRNQLGFNGFVTSSANKAVIAQGIENGILSRNNDAAISQTGTSHEAIIRQAYDSEGTAAFGSNSAAGIVQVGNSSYAAIRQEETADAAISQTGAFHTANIIQNNGHLGLGARIGSDEADIVQTGTRQQANIVQQGVNGTASILQDGDYNEAYIQQGVLATDALAEVQQNGNFNYVDVIQQTASATARAKQDGNLNVLLIAQTGNPDALAPNTTNANSAAWGSQIGNFNNATIRQ